MDLLGVMNVDEESDEVPYEVQQKVLIQMIAAIVDQRLAYHGVIEDSQVVVPETEDEFNYGRKADSSED